MALTFISLNLLSKPSKPKESKCVPKCNHNVVDELESLSYGFMWVIHEFTGPGVRVSERYADVVDMEHQNPAKSKSGKMGLFHAATDIVDVNGVRTGVTTYFRQSSIMKLYRGLCNIVFKLSRQKGLLSMEDKKLPVESSNKERRKVYKEILDLISEAITEFGNSKEGKEEEEALLKAEAAALAKAQEEAESLAEFPTTEGESQVQASVAGSDAPAQPADDASGDTQSLKKKKSVKKSAANLPRVGLRRSMRNLRVGSQTPDVQEEGSSGKRKQAPAEDEDEEILKKAKMEGSVYSDE